MSGLLPSVNSVISEFSLNDFTEKQQIGSGGEGVVFCGYNDRLGIVAVKRLNRQVNKTDMKEVILLAKHSNHPNIIHFFGLLTPNEGYLGDNESFYIGYIMEYMEKGSLFGVIHNASVEYDMKQVYSWIEKASSGLKYLHEKDIIHRDIKPQNILLGKSLDDLRISDFGLAKVVESQSIASLACRIGSVDYMAPELHNGTKYDKSADIYALTITFWEIIHRKRPYSYMGKVSRYKKTERILNGERPNIQEELKISALLIRGWDSNPKSRPKISEFIEFSRKKSPAQVNLLKVGSQQDLSIQNEEEFNAPAKEFSLNDFTEKQLIGRGDEGEVFRGYNDRLGKVAFKILNRQVNKTDMKEVILLAKHSNHPNIIRLFGLLTPEEGYLPNNRSCYIGCIMEYMESGSLFDVIHNASVEYDMKQVYSWIEKASSGLQYLHKEGIMHRNIAPQNILLGKSLEDLRISGFGLVKAVEPQTASHTYGIGTIAYMAPELHNGTRYGKPADIYALTITFWEIIHRERPYAYMGIIPPYKQINRILNGDRPNIQEELEISALLKRGWDSNPKSRAKISEFIEFSRKAQENLRKVANQQDLSIQNEEEFNAPAKEFSLNDFTEKQQIGIGGEGEVFRGYNDQLGKVAVKRLYRQVNKTDMSEVILLVKHSNHPNIIRLFGLLTPDEGYLPNNRSFCIGYIMEYMERGSLYNVIHNTSVTYDMKQVYSWIEKASSGLQYLHKEGIMHRNIAPQNILLGKSLDDLRISDFGLAKAVEPQTTSHTGGIGTIAYMAPELHKETKYGKSADIYALTITFWEIIHRERPYGYMGQVARFEQIRLILEGARPNIQEELEISALLIRGWDSNPKSRPKISEFIEFSRKKQNTSILILGGYKFLNTIYLLDSKAQSWKKLRITLPVEMRNFGAVVLNEEIYIFGGSSKNYLCLNPQQHCYKLKDDGSWMELASLNQKRSAISSSSLVYKGDIWAIGGNSEGPLKSVEKYNTSQNKWIFFSRDRWTYMPEMNYARCGAAAAVFKDRIFVTGGRSKKNLKSVEMFDPKLQKWILFCDLPIDVVGHTMLISNSTLSIFGGLSGSGRLNNVWEMDIEDPKKKWTKKQNFKRSRAHFGIGKLSNGIIVFGGLGERSGTISEIFDGNKWINGPRLPQNLSQCAYTSVFRSLEESFLKKFS